MRHKRRPQSQESTHHALAELAERQFGVVSGRQLTELGYSRSTIARARAAGRLHPLYRAVYAVGHLHLSSRSHCLAAVLTCNPGALLSHGSAAWLWGISSQGPYPIEVTVPTRRRSRDSIRLHHSGTLAPDDRATVDGIPVTALPRTLLDLATVLSLQRLERVFERAERLGVLDARPIHALLSRTAGQAGTGRLRRALELYRAEPAFTRSSLEKRFLALVEKAGLPAPRTNYFEAGYELDAYWPRERFAVELDGFETHRTRAAFERDRRRQEELKMAGIEMIRVTSRRLADEPHELARRIAALLERRRAG